MKCPGCGKSFKVPDEYIGKRVQCNKCGEKFVVSPPEPEPEPQLAGDPFPDPFAPEPESEPSAAAVSEPEEIDSDLEELLDTLADGKKKQRREAARQIRDLADPASLDILMDCMGDKDVEVRRYIAEALGEIGGKVALAGLIGMAYDDDSLVRVHAYEGMEFMPEAEEIELSAYFDEEMIACFQADEMVSAEHNIATGKLKETPFVVKRLFQRCDSLCRNPCFEQILNLDRKLRVKELRSHFAARCEEFGIEVSF